MSAGKVFLVGAGPGDPGLITVKGLKCVETADVIVCDRLVDRRIVARAHDQAEVLDVGKAPGGTHNRQEEINTLLVSKAREGKRVVRLKGGDPFVFGRGGEEAEFLAANGVPFEVVPGVTSAVAAPAYAGIPLTHREVGSHFTVVTGSESPDKPESGIAWEKLAQAGGTLVVLMGWESLPGIVDSLTRHGRAPETPAALVRWGTEPYQQTVVGTLSDIVSKGKDAGLEPPVVAVIGEAVSLRERLRWFDKRPLFGKRVLVTRSRTQAGQLSELLSSMGAHAIELPTIEIQPLEDYSELDSSIRQLGDYEWVVFTSANAVDIVFKRLQALGLDSRAFHGAKVAAIGPATAASVEERGIVADFVPDRFVSESVVEGMAGKNIKGAKILIPRAQEGRDVLSEGLARAGAMVHEIEAYRTVTPEDSKSRVAEILSTGVDAVTFTSSSTVTNLAGLLDGNLDGLSEATIACIGPITTATARALGLKVAIVAEEYTTAGLVDALEAYFQQEGLRDE